MKTLPCTGRSPHRNTAPTNGRLSLACSARTPDPAGGTASLAGGPPVEVRSPSAHGGMAAHTAAPHISTPDLGVLSHGRDPGPGNHCNSCQCNCFIRFGNIMIQEKTMKIAAESVHYDSITKDWNNFQLRACLDVVGFQSIHMCPLQSIPTHVD